MSACPLLSRPSPLIGALGTSITFGAELDAVEKGPSASAWPAVLQSLLRQQGYPSATVVNGAARGTGADYASLCFDHIWRHPNGSRAEHAPALDLVIIEYTWTSNTAMVEALVQMLHSRRIPVLGILYYHPANPYRFGHVKNDTTPWANVLRAVGGYRSFAALFQRLSVPTVNNSLVNWQYQYCEPDIMLAERRCQMPLTTRSKRHPSRLLHEILAKLVMEQLLASCSQLSLPPPTYSDGFKATCHIDEQLHAAVEPQEGPWQWHQPTDGRAASWWSNSTGATALVRLRTDLKVGFLSFGVERSHKNQAVARVECVPTHCACLAQDVDAHSPKPYTYTQRSTPVWATMVSGASHCLVSMRIKAVKRGRFAIRAAILSRPLAGNRSISARSLSNL